MKRIFVLFFVLFPSLVFAITFTVGNYRYSADTAAYGSSVLEQAKKAFSLQHIILSDDNKPEANLGYGFSTDRGTPVSPCIVDGGIEYGGTDKGFVEAIV